jgi:drug/metabolite transporter (DMT)-like permease
MSWWWLPLAAVAYGIFAVTGVVDKLVVTNKLRNPLVMSFWVALFGLPSALILLVGLWPAPWAEAFRFQMPTPAGLALITAAGLLLQLTLLLSYMALKHGEATRVVPTIGAAMPAFALVFAFLVLGERLPPLSYLAFAFLFIGVVLISARRGRMGGWWFWLALASAAAGAFQTVIIKLVYGFNHFISSLALLGLGNLVYLAVLIVLVPAVRREISAALHPKPARKPQRAKRLLRAGASWIFLNNLLGSVGVIVLNLSLKLGPVSLVNALKGLQYVGVFIIAVLLSRMYPKLLREELSAQSVKQKLSAIGAIALGVGLLVVAGS